MTVTHKINMDLTRRGVTPRINAVQADRYSRVVEIYLYSGGIEWVPPKNAKIVVRYSKPDGTCGNYDTLPNGDAAGTIDGNVVSVGLAPQVLSVAGVVQIAVGVIDGSSEINTFNLEIRVQKNPAGSDVPVDTYIDTSSATATAGDICSGKTAYVAGKKITGTHVCSVDTGKTAELTVTENGQYVPNSGIIGFSKVTVNVRNDIPDTTATPADVVAGKTFLASNGIVTEGTHVCDKSEVLYRDAVEVVAMSNLHVWTKTSLQTDVIVEGEPDLTTLSYRNTISSSDFSNYVWDTVSYADSVEVVDGAIKLVNPVSFTMSDETDNDVVLGKYVQSGYNGIYYRIPEDASVYYEKMTYGGGEYIRASTAVKLSVGVAPGTFVGYAISPLQNTYPAAGEQDGYWYEYVGTMDDHYA